MQNSFKVERPSLVKERAPYYSSVKSESARTTKPIPDTDQFSLSIAHIDPKINRSQWRSQKSCAVCGNDCGKAGLAQNKKHYCHFCYQAVCAGCSPLSTRHPETDRNERICMYCYVKYLEQKIAISGNGYVKEKLEAEIERKNKEIQRRKELEEEILKSKQDSELKESQMNIQIESLSQKLREYEETANRSKNNVESLQRENQELKRILDDLKRKELMDSMSSLKSEEEGGVMNDLVDRLSHQERENIRLKNELERALSRNRTANTEADSCACNACVLL